MSIGYVYTLTLVDLDAVTSQKPVAQQQRLILLREYTRGGDMMGRPHVSQCMDMS